MIKRCARTFIALALSAILAWASILFAAHHHQTNDAALEQYLQAGGTLSGLCLSIDEAKKDHPRCPFCRELVALEPPSRSIAPARKNIAVTMVTWPATVDAAPHLNGAAPLSARAPPYLTFA